MLMALRQDSVESCLHLDVGIPLEVLYEQVVGGEHTLQPVLGDHRDGGPSTALVSTKQHWH